MDLMPGMFYEGDGDIAKGWRELGSNPSSSDLLVGVVAGPENHHRLRDSIVLPKHFVT